MTNIQELEQELAEISLRRRAESLRQEREEYARSFDRVRDEASGRIRVREDLA